MKTFQLAQSILLSALLLSSSFAFSQNLFINPSFETPAVDVSAANYHGITYAPNGATWLFENGTGICHNDNDWGVMVAPDGVQFAFIQGGASSSFSQTVTLDPGNYAITFNATLGYGDNQTVKITIDGNPLSDIAINSAYPTFDLYRTTSFNVAVKGTYVVKFSGSVTGDNKAFIDQIYLSNANSAYIENSGFEALQLSENTVGGSYGGWTFDANSGIQIKPREVKVQVATYYFPNWGPVWSSEWSLLKAAKPMFNGHQQPKVPMWGYTNENDPVAMAQKIDAAADYGIDAFIFDWYFYDQGSDKLTDTDRGHWDGQKYLSDALEKGFLQASNKNKLKFSVMWCNHDLGDVKGAVKPATFESIIDYVIEKYFKQPNYWKINGCPYFSIYQVNSFLESYGNDYSKAAAAIELFRTKVKAAGFPDLHLNVVLYDLKTATRNQTISQLKINSTTSYVWIHHNVLPGFPSTEYTKAADDYFNSVENGGGHNGLENPANDIPVPYHINVSMGWDSSPRCRNAADWMKRRDYPFGPVIVNNTPYLFKKHLAKAKALTMLKPENERIITINSWNEWGEGSYLEPDMINGMKYLEAVKAVFQQ
ncbi:MAG: glycoside hydrolase family 99-like domain-containing protein [Lentimicrobium sp.]|nr:glycoside hydrolase family 99-like domain-containing protein [Lentimicrobium sp.]